MIYDPKHKAIAEFIGCELAELQAAFGNLIDFNLSMAERSETGNAKRDAKNLRRLAAKLENDTSPFDLSEARDDLLFKASVAEHFARPEGYPATKGRNERARVIACAIARVFVATGRSIGLGKDAYTGEPSTPFGRAVKQALAVYEIQSGWYRPAEHAAKLARNPN